MAITYLSGKRIQGATSQSIGTAGDWDTTSNVSIASSVTTPTDLGNYYWESNSSNSNLSLTDGYILPTESDFTLSMWVNPDSLSTTEDLINRTYDGGFPDPSKENGNQISLMSNGTNIYVNLSSTGTTLNANATHGMSTGNWYNIVQTFDRSAGETKIYINNVLKLTEQDDGAKDKTMDQDNWSAVNTGGGDDSFDGQTMEFTTWNKMLSAENIEDLYNSGDGTLANTIESTNILTYYAPASSGFTNQASTTDDKDSVTDVPDGSEFEQTNDYKSYQFNINPVGLKGYWRFDETSGSVINVATGSDDLGSTVDLTITNDSGNYDDTSSPFGYGMHFDGTADYGAFGTSTSVWNYQHSTTAKWTRCFWMKLGASVAEQWLLGNTESTTGSYNYIPNQELYQRIVNTDGVSVVSGTTTGTFIPDLTTWYFYSITYDQSLSSDNLKIKRNGDNEQTFTKTAYTPTNEDADNARTLARKSGTSGTFGNFYICELSEWSRVLTDDEITLLYNLGDGLDILTGLTEGIWTERGTAI